MLRRFSCIHDRTEEATMGYALQGDTALAIWRSLGIGLTVFGKCESGPILRRLHTGAVPRSPAVTFWLMTRDGPASLPAAR